MCLLAGLAYACLSVGPGPARIAILVAFAAFAAYSGLLYLAGWKLLSSELKGRFYVVTAILDLGFVAVLLHLTGGGQSPFYRALFLWVAMLAFYFGRKAGMLASVAALTVFIAFHVPGRFSGDPWVLAAQAGGVLLHGPLIGYLVDRERRRTDALREANGQLADTHRRLLEEQAKVVQAEKLSSIGLLAAGVAHEINNPLGGVMGCVKVLQQGNLPVAGRDRYFEAVRDGLDRIHIIVQGLLDYARQRPPAVAGLDAAEVVSSCSRLIAPVSRQKDVRVDVHIPPGARCVRADRSQLMQAIVNVLMNAVYAAPRGSAVEISSPVLDGRIGIRIADQGPGIPREILVRVCDPFFTTKPEGEGTGLGLAVTLGIVRSHGGDLEIDSEDGRGTAVTLWLPREEAAARA